MALIPVNEASISGEKYYKRESPKPLCRGGRRGRGQGGVGARISHVQLYFAFILTFLPNKYV